MWPKNYRKVHNEVRGKSEEEQLKGNTGVGATE